VMLLSVLHNQYGQYRPQLMLTRARQWLNWDSMATIYTTRDQWDGAIHAKLTQIRLHFEETLEQKLEEANAVLSMLSFLNEDVFTDEEIQNRDVLLYQVLEFWKQEELPVAPLSRYVLLHLNVLAPLFGQLLRKNTSTDHPFCVKFGLQVHLHITKTCLEQIKLNYSKEKQDKPPEERLWTEIKDNLYKDLNKKDKIVLNLENTPPSKTDLKDYAFTCGHHFSRSRFLEDILPHFQEKVAAFSNPLPITTRLMVLDYQQPEIALACPVCVYNDLRKKQKVTREKWEV